MKTKTRQLEIYEGEIWLVSSTYSWKKCLIIVDGVFLGRFLGRVRGKVIATENPDALEKDAMEHQLENPEVFWRFKRGELLRRIQKSH